jgi:hypothetical protein
MAAELDVQYTCQACGARGGIHVEVEPIVEEYLLDVGPEEAGPGDYARPHPWQGVQYPDDDGARPWEAPDGVAERAALEEIEESLKKSFIINCNKN